MVRTPKLVGGPTSSEALNSYLQTLDREDLTVVQGLTPYYAGSIALMADQKHIRRFSPEDHRASRFATEASTRRWLASESGKAVFLLLEPVDGADDRRLAGYGWAAPATTPFVDGGETVFAVRLGERYRSTGLSTPFGNVILEASRQMFRARNFWLSTWATNRAAVRAYGRLGFEIAYEMDPTTERKGPGLQEELDARIYMKLPE